jgi:hypothetical protein
MRLRVLASFLALLFYTAPATATEAPDPALALITGAGTDLAGIVIGGALVATSHGHDEQTNAGWLTMEGSFALAPLAAHGVVGEWGRGAWFTAVPLGAVGGTATLFGLVPGAVEGGSLPQQRLMWAFFVIGLFGSAVGVVDSVFAPDRARSFTVAPSIGKDLRGLQIGGTL